MGGIGSYALSKNDWDRTYGNMSPTGRSGGLGGVRYLNPVEQAAQQGESVKAGMDAMTGGKGLSGLTSAFATGGAATPPPMPDKVAPPVGGMESDPSIMLRAKERQGLLNKSSLRGLRSSLAARGQLGGGAERKGVENIIETGQGNLGEINREQAIQEGQQKQDMNKLGYTGEITQRGQNLQARGQELQLAQQQQDRMMQALIGLMNASKNLY